jgi:hypothetical protein
MARARDYDRHNEESARIISCDPARYAGLPLAWTRLWLERHGTARKPATKLACAAATG